jgi:hypothetical protein
VPGLGHDQLQRHLLLAEVGGGRVAELVQFQAAVLLEQDPRPVVTQPGAAGAGADVAGRGAPGRDGLPRGEEQRPAGAGSAVGRAQQPGQEVRGPGVPVDKLGVAALGPDRGAALLEVEVLDVEREDLAGAGGS